VTILILEHVPSRVRGELTRWMLEPRAGVFVGTVSALVRDKLWERICEHTESGSCVLVHDSDSEQGFMLRTHGESRRLVEDFEGLSLIRLKP